jgi:hypothetical protein
MGDYLTYDYVVGVRAATSTDDPFDMKFIGHVAASSTRSRASTALGRDVEAGRRVSRGFWGK